jgi:hypothetical protein
MLRTLAIVATLTAFAACSSANGGGSDRDDARWSWLAADGGTYWYVPTANLLAYGWSTDDPQNPQPIDDQTVWHIERYENGYFFGPVVAEFQGFPAQCQYLIGSVTPEGRVYITFNGLQAVPSGTPSLTTGIGAMVKADGSWTFNMQMASGSSSVQVTHWAFMVQCSPDEPCWSELPSVGQSLPSLLSECDTN